MIGPAQSTEAAELAKTGAPSDSTQEIHTNQHDGRSPRWLATTDGRRAIGWIACGVVAGLVIVWLALFSTWQAGSKAEWFFGAGVFGVVVVAMWQNLEIQRQAKQDAAEAAQRLRIALTAAEARSAEVLAQARELHNVEMAAQRELARVHRNNLLEQQQKQAVIDVSRTIGAHTQMLATLWNQAANILRIEDRDEREEAMNPIFDQIGQVVNEFSVEIANAHLLTEDDRLHAALKHVSEAVLMAIHVAEDLHVAVVEGRAPQPNPIPDVQRVMLQRAAEARHLAWDLVRAGLGST